MEVSRRIAEIRATLREGVKLVAVSKFHTVEALLEAYNAGQRIFGESRVPELAAKQSALPDDIEWHFIGPLQANKVKYIAPFISMIQSVDTLRLMSEIDRQAAKCGRKISVLIEVHIAEEESKHGFSTGECRKLFEEGAFKRFENIRICGLMGMATFTDNTAQIRREFAGLRDLFDEIRSMLAIDKNCFSELSMGMSDDYETAIEAGSTMVRLGTVIFGKR